MPDADTNPSAASPRQSASGLQAACITRLFLDDAGLSRRAEGPRISSVDGYERRNVCLTLRFEIVWESVAWGN